MLSLVQLSTRLQCLAFFFSGSLVIKRKKKDGEGCSDTKRTTPTRKVSTTDNTKFKNKRTLNYLHVRAFACSARFPLYYLFDFPVEKKIKVRNHVAYLNRYLWLIKNPRIINLEPNLPFLSCNSWI